MIPLKHLVTYISSIVDDFLSAFVWDLSLNHLLVKNVFQNEVVHKPLVILLTVARWVFNINLLTMFLLMLREHNASFHSRLQDEVKVMYPYRLRGPSAAWIKKKLVHHLYYLLCTHRLLFYTCITQLVGA